MFGNRTFGTRDAELQSTLMTLHDCRYRGHEDVLGIFLHDDFRGDALRGEYYATSYLRHRLPLLFRLALCKWRPHRRAKKTPQGLRNKKRGVSASSSSSAVADGLSGHGASHHSSSSETVPIDGESEGKERCGASSSGTGFGDVPSGRAAEGNDSAFHGANTRRPGSRDHLSPALPSESRRGFHSGDGGQWETQHRGSSTTPTSSTPTTPTPADTRSASSLAKEDSLTPEQQTRLSILALQVLCGDRSRVREGSSEAATAACGPVWDAHTVRDFYESHRRLVRWTCRVLRASCEWVEDVVRRAVDDELLAVAPPSVTSPVDDFSANASSGCEDGRLASMDDVVAQEAPSRTFSFTEVPTQAQQRRGRTSRALSAEARPRQPASTDYSAQPSLVSERATAAEAGPYPRSIAHAPSEAGSELPPHFGHYRRSPYSTPAVAHHQHHHQQQQQQQPQQHHLHSLLSKRPPPPHAVVVPSKHPLVDADVCCEAANASALPPPHPSSLSHNARRTFTSTGDLEVALQLHCRRIRHALMVLESLLVSLVMVQSYIYRAKPGRSSTPPWLRRKSSSSSSGSEDFSDSDDDDEDDSEEDAEHEDYGDGGERVGGGPRKSGRRRHRHTSANGGLRHSIYEYRLDSSSSFETDDGGDEGHTEEYAMQMEAEADEPPLDLLVRHCLHAYTQTFLSITAVQQQLQDYSHESRHAAAASPSSASTATTTAAAIHRSFAATSPLPSSEHGGASRLFPLCAVNRQPSGNANSSIAERGSSSAVSPTTPMTAVESEAGSLVAARGTPAAYACARCQRFHQVEEVLLVAANDNLEVLKKAAIAFAAHHSAIAEESIRVIDAEGAVFTSQATMLLAHVLTPEVLAAHPPGSRGGMALEWVLNYVFGGCSGADVRQHQQQQEKQHTAATADVNSSFDCFSLANSSFSSTNPHSVDTGDADGRSSDGGWRTAGGGAAENSESGGSSVPSSSGRWNVNRFEYGDDVAIDSSLNARRNGSDGHHNGHHNDDSSGSNTTDESDGETPQQAAAQEQREERQATNLRVEYILAACFTRCHPLMTVIGCVAENNQYNCGRTVAQAVLQYAFTLSQTSARLLRTPLLTGTWSTPFTEAMMRGLSELAAHVHQSVAVTPSLAQPGSGAAANLTCSFASSSATAALNRGVTPAQLIKSTNGSFAPFLVAQLQVPASLVSSAMRRVPRPRPYAFIPPPAAVVSGASPADESEAAQVRTMRRCLALHWAKCVLLSARTLTRAGTYDVPVPFEHYLNIRTARVQMRGRMMEYRDRMRAHFVAAGDHAKVKRLDETFERWEADERRMDEHDRDIVEDTNGSFTTATAPYTMQGTPATPGLYTVDPFGRVSPAPVAEGREAAADAVAAGQSHFDSHHTAHTLTANVATFASPAGTVAPRPDGARDPQSLLLLPEATDDSSPGSIGADPLGRSFSGTATTEKESYRRAFVDSFCFGKSDLELLSAALLGKSRTAVPVPIHVIVCTSLFSILDAMGDVLLCEKPRLNSVVANELMTLMYEAQLSMLEPLHDGAMAVVERTGASTPTTTTTSAASSLSSSFPRMEPFSQALEQQRSVSSRKSDTSDSFVSPGSSRLPSTAASSASSVTVSSGDDDEEGEEAEEDAGGHDGTDRGGGGGGRTLFLKRCAEGQIGGADAVDAAGEQQRGFNDSFASSNSGDDDRSADGDEEGISGSGGTGGGSADGDVALQSFGSHSRGQDRRKKKKKKKRSAHATRMDSTTLARDGHILLFNEYALLLEAGLRSPLVVRRWREDVRANPDHAARGYLSLLDHLQYRQSQWAEPSQEEYLISRSTLRLMLGVTARDARGNMHGNILHVDDLDVLGSRKEEVAPRLGVTSSKDSLTTLFSDEWDPTTVEAVEDPTPRSSGAATAAGEGSSEAGVAATRSSADQLLPLQPSLRPPQFPPPCGLSADSMPQRVGSTEAMAAQAAMGERKEGAGRPPLSGQLLAAAPLTAPARLLGPRTSSFECVSLLGTRLETGDDDEEDDDEGTRGGRKAGSSVGRHVSVRELLHQHHHDRVHQHFIDADDTSLNSSDDSDGDHRPLPPVNRHAAYAQGGDDEGLGEGPDNSSFVSAGSFHSESDGEEHHPEGQEEAEDERPADAVAAATTRAPSSLASAQDAEPATLAAEKGVGSLRGSRHGSHAERSPSHGQGLAVRGGTAAPWKHQPTRVTLAGAGAELDTMVRRMPYTWTLASPLPDGAGTQTEKGDRTLSPQPSLSQPQSPVPEAGERGADVNGRDVATASAAAEGGSPPAMPLRVDTVVHYAPVVVAAAPGAETTVSREEEEGEEEEEEEEEGDAVKAGDVVASIGGDHDNEEADGQAEAEIKDEERGELSREESARSVNPLDAVAGNMAASDAEESADADPPTSAERCPLKDAEHTDGVERDTAWPDAASDAVLLSLAAADVPTSEVDASVPLKSASQPAWMRPLVSPVPELASQTDAVAALLTRRVPACLSGQASPANSLSPSSSSNRIDMEESEGAAAAAEEREEEEGETRSTQPDTEYLRGYGRGPLALSPRCDGLGDDDMHNDSGSDYCEIDESRLLSAAPRLVPPAAHAAQAAAATSASLLLSPPQEHQQQQPLASPSVPSVSLRSSAASSTASLPAVEDEGEAVSPLAAHITVASQRPVYRVTVVEPLTCDGTNSAPRRRATTPQTQSPFSLSRGLGSAKADSAPLSLDASPVNDVALSRAIHRVLSHRRSLPSSSSSPILSSAGSMSETTRGGGGGGQSLSEPVSPASRSPASGSPAGGVGAVARDPAAAVGAAAAMATPNVSPNNTASRRRQQQQHSREAWTETLTQLKLTATVAEAATTIPTTADAGPEDGQRSPHSTRRESTAGDEGPSRRRSSRGSPGLSLLNQSKGNEGAVTDAAAAKTTNVVEGRLSDQREKKRVVNDEGPAVEPAPTPTAAAAHTLPSLTAAASAASSSSPTTTATTTAGGRSSSSCLDAADAASRGSNDSFTSTSPNASHSAPHDLQWYTGANARSSALRPPRSTVSTDGPMSPVSAFPYRFPVVEEEGLSNSGSSPAGGALALPTGAEGVSSNVRIGQGVGKSRQWFAGAAAAAHSSASRTSAQPQQPLQQSLSGGRAEGGGQRTVDSGVVAASSASTHASSAAADRESPLPANAVRTLPEVHHSSGSIPAHERGGAGSAYSRAGRFSHTPSAATAGATNTASAARGGGGGAAWPTDGEATGAAPHPPPPPLVSAAATALSSSPGGRPRAELSDSRSTWAAKGHVSGGSESMRVAVTLPPESAPTANTHSDSPLNSRYAGATGYASSNDSDVST